MTPDQYRREGAEEMREAIALQFVGHVRENVRRTPLPTDAIRAIDVDEVLAGMPPAPDAVARLVEAARTFASWDQCWPGNINLKTACRDIRSAIAAMETNHDLL